MLTRACLYRLKTQKGSPSMTTRVKKIMVIGAGQMGSGIAQVAAQSGLTVVLNDIKPEFTDRGLTTIRNSLSRFVQKGKLPEDEMTAILGRIIPSNSLEDGKDCDMAIEAATENMQIKLDIFRQLDEILPAHAILASNTSSLPITEIAAVTK